MSDRETIFNSIRKALDPLPEKTPYPEWDPKVTISNFAKAETADDVLFTERFKAAKGKPMDGWQGLADFLKENGVTKIFLDPSLVEAAGGVLDAFAPESAIDRERIDEFGAGITPTSGAIAESGTIILRDSDTPFRLGALAPWIHVAVVRRDDLYRTVPEALAQLGDDPSIIFVTGPSKTADIEGILIEGVHGPGVQACLLI